jgi:hypothetical protein
VASYSQIAFFMRKEKKKENTPAYLIRELALFWMQPSDHRQALQPRMNPWAERLDFQHEGGMADLDVKKTFR